MRNRRFALVAFMLVAVLTMSVGFAAFSTTLAIHGTTSVSQEAIDFTEDVHFISVVSSNEAFGTASIGDGQTATFDVSGMTVRNNSVTFTYVIENTSDYEVNIQITTHPTPAAATHCSVTTSLSSDTIAAGGNITATVIVVLSKDMDEVMENVNWVIEYTATSVEA